MSEERFPISPTRTCLDLVYFPRLLDKIRLKAAGALPEVYHANLGQGMDSWTCQFLHVNYPDLVERVLVGGLDDEAALEWCYENGRRPNAFEVRMFNEYLSKRGFRDDMSERLVWRKEEAGAADRADIQTFFDYIDFDEGRR